MFIDIRTQVGSQKPTGSEVAGKEEGKAIAEEEHNQNTHADPRRPWLKARAVRHRDALTHTSLSKALEDNATEYPGRVARCVRETNEPVEYNTSLRTAGEISQGREEGGCDDGV